MASCFFHVIQEEESRWPESRKSKFAALKGSVAGILGFFCRIQISSGVVLENMLDSPPSDLQLLALYLRDQAEDAFAEIVRRHIDLVYAAALRQVRSPHVAEEIAQSVFLELVRHADRLAPDTILSAWLYEVTHNKAVNVARRESRRRSRERIAVEVNSDNDPSAEWTHIEPLLDQGMQALNGSDRLAILLRYFENRSLREVGEAFGISDDAAQKRVNRAVDRLRVFLVRRGVSIRTYGLAKAIGANAVVAGPAGLASVIDTAVKVGAGGANSLTSIAIFSTALMTTLQKTAVTCVIVAILGAVIYWSPLATNSGMRSTAIHDEGEPFRRNVASDSSALVNGWNSSRLDAQKLGAPKIGGSQDPAEEELQFLQSRVEKLKRFSAENPKLQIPEFRFLTDREWLEVARNRTRLESESDFRIALADLRMDAQNSFARLVPRALRDYASANQGDFPSYVGQLKPYFKQPIDDAILQRYAVQQPEQMDWTRACTITDVALVDDYYDEPIIIRSDGWTRGPKSKASDGRMVAIKRFFDAVSRRLLITHAGS